MPATVFTRKVIGPATHALVIGVGRYPHLGGGGGPQTKVAHVEGMRQLASPPLSARTVAQWLLEHYDSADRPLASLALLTSEKSSKPFVFKARGSSKTVSVTPAVASMAEVSEAIEAWHARGDENPGHLLLFYFCGHGISAGIDLALLLSNFGDELASPLIAGALDFRRFHTGMEECAARHQCYFIDACQVGSELIVRNAGLAGRPVIEWTGTKPNPGGQLSLGPTFYSTVRDEGAYAQAGKVSIFTGALLEALNGAACADENGAWIVQAGLVHHAIAELMKKASETLSLPLAQTPKSEVTGAISLNTLVDPFVPVFVNVEPTAAHAVAVLRCEGGVMAKPIKAKRKPNPLPWHLSVPIGTYSFYADFKANSFKADPRLNQEIRPPYQRRTLQAHQ